MKSVKITKAGEVAGKAPADVVIEFTGAPPEFGNVTLPLSDFYKTANDYYEQQATQLGSALIETLPGGTLDRLICFLLRQKASYFRVPYVEPRELLFSEIEKAA